MVARTRRWRETWAAGVATAAVALLGMAVMAVSSLGLAAAPAAGASSGEGIHKIQHVVIIMQENRSFDSYFGTYPGANGIPASVCAPDPLNGGCVKPYYDPNNENYGGPHGHGAFEADLDEGRMDGFVAESEKGESCKTTNPNCSPCKEEAASAQCVDSMGYHDARELPNYWTYAANFVLQDDMFESASSWSWPEHLFMVSGWSAACKEKKGKWIENAMDCVSVQEGPPDPEDKPDPYKEASEFSPSGPISLPWTDITYLLHKHVPEVSWRYYIFEGDEPDCEDNEAMTCAPVQQGPSTPGIWNPLVDFTDVKEDNQLEDVQSLSHFYEAVHDESECGLPNVSWITPNALVSEHPPALISAGQAYVTTLINSVMRSPCWDSTAVFLSWDDWGGFYDSVVPPTIDEEGYGFRVPGVVISPYAKAGYIDHQQLSHDAYLKFIEDDFLEGGRLNPKTDGRPDSRPVPVREEAPGLGNLESDFDFNQPPRQPLILPSEPAPGPASCPPGSVPPGASAPEPLAPCPYTLPPAPPAPAPTPAPSPPATVTPLILQLTASVAAHQDVRLNHGRVYLMVGCNMACSLYAHGHLSLVRRHRHLRLRSVRTSLVAHRTVGVALSLSRHNLDAVRRALRRHRAVKALIDVEATAASGLRQSYLVSVTLTWR
jgi:phospholipase C